MTRAEMEDALEATILKARGDGVDLDEIITTLEGMKDRYVEEQENEEP